MASPVLFDRLALIGVGLIGGSIARAARALGIVREIVATSRAEPTRQRIRELGLADEVVDTSAEAVAGADLVIVCVPIGACGAVAKEIGPHLKPGATVSDVGSVKAAVVRDIAGEFVHPDEAVPPLPSTTPGQLPRGLGGLIETLTATTSGIGVHRVADGRYIAYLPGPDGGSTAA